MMAVCRLFTPSRLSSFERLCDAAVVVVAMSGETEALRCDAGCQKEGSEASWAHSGAMLHSVYGEHGCFYCFVFVFASVFEAAV